MKKIILSAIFALIVVPSWASAADVTNLAELNAALADTSTTTINIQGVIQLTSQLHINRPVALIGVPGAGFIATTDFGSDNSTKHLVEIDGITSGTVEFTNLDFNSGLKADGVQAYSMSDATQVVFTNVTMQNSKSIGLNVNGSNVTATNLTTTGNAWGAVDVDPGTGVTGTSTLTLNASNLTETTQIWSDGAKVTPNSPVVVNAPGYDKYAVAGAPTFFLWTNRPLTDKVVNSTAKVIYPTIQSAIDAASTTSVDIIALNANTTISSEIIVNKAVIIDGNGHTLFAPFAKTDNTNNAAIGILHSGVTVKNLIEDGTGSTGSRHGINIFEATSTVLLDNVTVQNNSASGITLNGSTVTVNNITTKNNAWGGINADQAADAPDATVLTVTGTSSHTETGPAIWVDNNLRAVTVNDSSNQYASANYASSVTTTGRFYTLKSVSVTTEAGLRAALANTLVSTITLASDITLAAELDIARSVTINGAGHTVSAGFNAASVIQVQANDVTLMNLVETAIGTTGNRGINIFHATGVLLDNVTASNNSKNGIVVNGSTATVNNVTTKNNGFGAGINVDKGTVASPASLTINGVSSHAEPFAAIKIDDTTIGTVIDTNSQYSFIDTIANGTTTRNYALSGNVSASNPKVSIISAVTPVTLTVTAETVNPQIDVHTLITAGSGTLPSITISSAAADVDIATSTLVTGPTNWDGIIQAPSVVASTGNAPSGFSVGANVISVGSPDGTLTFDKAVKITLAGVTGTVGYKPAGSSDWQIIATQCTGADDHSNISANECYFQDGANTVIWTYHFTSFGPLALIPAPTGGSFFVGSSSSGSSSAGSSFSGPSLAVDNTPAVTGQVLGVTTSDNSKGQVLGASAFAFTRNMSLGARGTDVAELQKMLVAAGHLKLSTTTQYFGPLTKTALIKWQAKNKLPATGYFGPMSRALVIK